MLEKDARAIIEMVLKKYLGSSVNVKQIRPVGGGSINEAFKVETNSTTVFVKINSAGRFPGMFDAESKGLELLKSTNVLSTPAVLCVADEGELSLLILQWIESGRRDKDYWEKAGESLALLHKHKGSAFGLDHDNYIGSLFQSNKKEPDGKSFMIAQRFDPLFRQAIELRLLDVVFLNAVDSFYERLSGVLPDEEPSMLHGDLWNGNLITGPDGKACFIDPSVYFGYRETDLAMTRLFGGFEEGFYQSYQSVYPLSPGWQERIELFQLYPLLVHLILFGSGYRNAVQGIVRKYSR